MYRTYKLAVIAALPLSALLLASCVAHPHRHAAYSSHRYAPEYSHRYTYHDHGMVYDRNLGVYIVVGQPHSYFYDGYYYRYGGGVWYISSHPDRGWHESRHRDLPPGLAKKYGRRHDHGHRGRGRG